MRFGRVLFDVRSLRVSERPNVDLGVDNGHGKVKALRQQHQAIVDPDFEKIIGLLFAAVDLAHKTVVEELRGFGGLRFRYRFGEKVQDSLKTRFRRHELAAKPAFL